MQIKNDNYKKEMTLIWNIYIDMYIYNKGESNLIKNLFCIELGW